MSEKRKIKKAAEDLVAWVGEAGEAGDVAGEAGDVAGSRGEGTLVSRHFWLILC